MSTRVRYGISSRPHYAYGVFSAAILARNLGLRKISVIEFGVAGGRGLVALESISAEVSQELGVDIKVFGFDSGQGMPPPVDYRDLPFMWSEGDYQMDPERLRANLKNATLLLGDVTETVPAFAESGAPPIGFVAFDLDYYSSTKQAFRLFDADEGSRLPRVFCYFDDISSDVGCHNEFVGELCAIREFNLEHEEKKLSPIHLLQYMLPHSARWNEQIYVLHDFRHTLYCTNVTRSNSDWSRELPL
jgi:hypothetical protein